VVCLDAVIVFSKDKRDHIAYLRRVFNICRKYVISVNPKNCIFAFDEGRLTWFIVSIHGMRIELESTEAIAKIPPPHNKTLMQYFLEKLNFVRRFVPIFAEIVKPLQDMIKKNTKFKWGPRENESFDRIKAEIVQAPALLSLYFSQGFILYTFS
jgi:hypothetical protein